MNASDHHLCCLYCSKKSQELKQSSKQGSQSTTRPDSRSSSGLKCIKCQSFGCKVCLRALTKKLKEKVKHNKADTAILNADTWYREVMKYLGKKNYHPSNFLGSCCEIDKPKKQGSTRPPTQAKKSEPPTIDHGTETDDLGGTLYLHEFGLLVNSPFDCVDIHGLGEQENRGSSPTGHCVISNEYASLLKQDRNAIPKPFDMNEVQLLETSVPLPHCKFTQWTRGPLEINVVSI